MIIDNVNQIILTKDVAVKAINTVVELLCDINHRTKISEAELISRSIQEAVCIWEETNKKTNGAKIGIVGGVEFSDRDAWITAQSNKIAREFRKKRDTTIATSGGAVGWVAGAIARQAVTSAVVGEIGVLGIAGGVFWPVTVGVSAAAFVMWCFKK